MGADQRGSAGGALRALRTGFAALADLALPGECAGCGAGAGRTGAGGLCPGCAAVLRARPYQVRATRSMRGRAGVSVVYALARYQEPLSDLIIAQKERGRLDLAGPLGRALAGVVGAALVALDGEGDDGGADPVGPLDLFGPQDRSRSRSAAAADGWAGRRVLLIPVPSAKAAERRRGHDPVLRMARVAAARLRRAGTAAEVLRALRHGRAVSDQVGLSVAARAANLAGAVRVTAAAQRALSDGPCTVVLLDDVCTSGATLGEAGRAVRSVPGFREGGGRLAAAVLAGPAR